MLVGVVLIAGLTYWRMRPETTPEGADGPALSVERAWLQRARRGCREGQVRDFLEAHPPPKGHPPAQQRAGFAAACHAFAGDMDGVRRQLDGVAEHDRLGTLRLFFHITHSVADEGPEQELAMGDAMELVAKRWPENYQAVFHAGMAAYAREDFAHARERLAQFLKMYERSGIYRRRATETLAAIDAQSEPAADAGVGADAPPASASGRAAPSATRELGR